MNTPIIISSHWLNKINSKHFLSTSIIYHFPLPWTTLLTAFDRVVLPTNLPVGALESLSRTESLTKMFNPNHKSPVHRSLMSETLSKILIKPKIISKSIFEIWKRHRNRPIMSRNRTPIGPAVLIFKNTRKLSPVAGQNYLRENIMTSKLLSQLLWVQFRKDSRLENPLMKALKINTKSNNILTKIWHLCFMKVMESTDRSMKVINKESLGNYHYWDRPSNSTSSLKTKPFTVKT